MLVLALLLLLFFKLRRFNLHKASKPAHQPSAGFHLLKIRVA